MDKKASKPTSGARARLWTGKFLKLYQAPWRYSGQESFLTYIRRPSAIMDRKVIKPISGAKAQLLIGNVFYDF